MEQFDFNKYLKNNPLLKEAKASKDDGDEIWFSNADYFKKEHTGYKLKPTDKVSVGDGPVMTYADAVKKYASKKIKEGDMEESFKDRISTKRTDANSPQGDMAKIFAAVKQEAGSDYEVKYSKGAIYVLPDIGSGAIGRVVGVRIEQDPGNKIVRVGLTNGTIDGSGASNMTDVKKFNGMDIDGIIDGCVELLQKMQDETWH